MSRMNVLPLAAAALLLGGAAAASAASPAPATTPRGAQAQEARGDTPGGGGLKVPVPVTGEQVYRNVCQACHMADAKGGTGAGVIPALAGNPNVGVAAYPITIVLKGKGAMPGFAGALSDQQIANVVGYVRTHFGNAYPEAVTPAQVAQMGGR